MLAGKPDAGNLHVRFDEGGATGAAKAVRCSLLYLHPWFRISCGRCLVSGAGGGGLCAFAGCGSLTVHWLLGHRPRLQGGGALAVHWLWGPNSGEFGYGGGAAGPGASSHPCSSVPSVVYDLLGTVSTAKGLAVVSFALLLGAVHWLFIGSGATGPGYRGAVLWRFIGSGDQILANSATGAGLQAIRIHPCHPWCRMFFWYEEMKNCSYSARGVLG